MKVTRMFSGVLGVLVSCVIVFSATAQESSQWTEPEACPVGYVQVDVPSADWPRIFTPKGYDPVLLDGTIPRKCGKCTRWANGWAGNNRPPPDDPVWSMSRPVARKLPHGTTQVCVRIDASASFCDEQSNNDPTRLIYSPGGGLMSMPMN